MKKFFGLVLILLTTFILASCSKNNKKDGEVILSGISTVVSSEKKTTTASSYSLLSTTEETGLDYQCIFLKEGENYFDLTINLENPNDYHIFDFTLTCDDVNAKVYLNGRYQLLNSLKSINWQGDTNDEYSLNIYLENEDFLTTIALTSMYFSDRNTGGNLYSVNLNNKGTVEVYRVEDGFNMNMQDYWHYSLEVAVDYIDGSSLKVNGVPYTEGTVIESLGHYCTVEYEYILNNSLRITRTEVLQKPFFGTISVYPHVRVIVDTEIYAGEYTISAYKSTGEHLGTITADDGIFIFVENVDGYDHFGYFIVNNNENYKFVFAEELERRYG